MRNCGFGLRQSQHLNVCSDLRNYLEQTILPVRDEVRPEAEEPRCPSVEKGRRVGNPPGPQGVVFLF